MALLELREHKKQLQELLDQVYQAERLNLVVLLSTLSRRRTTIYDCVLTIECLTKWL